MYILKRIVVLLVLLFIAGGIVAVFQGLSVIFETLLHIFPIFEPLFEQALEDYLTSAYFIVGVIVFLLSSIGVYLSIRGKKVLYIVVSSILDILSLISIISNLVACQ